MSTLTLPSLTANNQPIDTSDEAFGWLRSSEDLVGDPEALRERLAEDGYLYIKNYLPQDIVHSARMSMLQRLSDGGFLDPVHPIEDGACATKNPPKFTPSLANPNPEVARVVFGPELTGFYANLLGGPIRHFDYVWVRSLGKETGTAAHCDLVYMGRGTHKLLTCWVPYGEVPLEQSPLMLLEDSHKKSERIKKYLSGDVDTYCENKPKDVQKVKVEGGWGHNGWLSKNCVSLREKLGGRWLTAHFQPGDFLTFQMNMIHASLDNQTNKVRLSTDTRYQLASEPIDERWIGENPPAHGLAGKRGRIC
jgi:hypothetical protein